MLTQVFEPRKERLSLLWKRALRFLGYEAQEQSRMRSVICPEVASVRDTVLGRQGYGTDICTTGSSWRLTLAMSGML